MNKTYVIIVLIFAFISCTLSSFLDIPPPPERPLRFKTKEQIENYLKSIKAYYDAFKIKLVRRENMFSNQNSNLNRLTNEELNDQVDLFKKLYQIYQENQYQQQQQQTRKK